MTTRHTRATGVAFEREVADLYAAAGFEVRGLEASGDHLCMTRDGLLIHSEAKRQERLRLPEWWAQCVSDAPAGAVPVLTFRQSRREPLSVIRTADLLRLIGRGDAA
jgi:hypothetical protein